MKKYNFKILGLGFLVLLIIGGCSSKNDHLNNQVIIPVKTVAVVKKEMSIPIRTSGRLSPKAQMKLSFKTGGIIERIYADEGSSVKKGDLLASLNLAEVQARFNQAQNGFNKTKRDLERVKNLFKDRAATLEQLQNSETAYELAQANLKIARFNLDHSKIKAPSRGKILKKLVEVNEMIGMGHPVFLFGSTENQWVIKTGVSEREIVTIQNGDKATVFFDSYPEKPFSATVSEISESVDPQSGTYEVEMVIKDEGFKLVAGFIARVNIVPTKKNMYTLIPVDALVDSEGNEAYVFFPEGNKARKIKIKIAHLFKDRVAVSAGLESSDIVITDGAAYLNDGILIKIIN